MTREAVEYDEWDERVEVKEDPWAVAIQPTAEALRLHALKGHFRLLDENGEPVDHTTPILDPAPSPQGWTPTRREPTGPGSPYLPKVNELVTVHRSYDRGSVLFSGRVLDRSARTQQVLVATGVFRKGTEQTAWVSVHRISSRTGAFEF